MKTLRFFIFAIVVLSLLTACSSLQPQKESEKTRLERQVAETNEKIEELSHKLSILQFMVDDHQKTLKEIEATQEAGAISTQKSVEVQQPTLQPAVGSEKATAPVSGENADQLYKKALSVYKDRNYGKAAAIFNSIFENYPGHNLADNALYWTGECFYAQKNYKGAIRAFKKVLEKYPGGSKVSDSLLKIGYSYLALGDKTNAQSFLKKVVKQYPFTPAGSKAGEMLKRIKSK
jgi:tol-pal system protein YbgF